MNNQKNGTIVVTGVTGLCGSPLWYRHDQCVDDSCDYEIPVGLLNNADGIEFKREIFIDRKPDSFAFAGDHVRLSEAETLALFGVEVDDN